MKDEENNWFMQEDEECKNKIKVKERVHELSKSKKVQKLTMFLNFGT